jgi:hypothetical protein
MQLRTMAICLLAVFVADGAEAQSFSNIWFFGDSNTDSGRYAIPQPWPIPAHTQPTLTRCGRLHSVGG